MKKTKIIILTVILLFACVICLFGCDTHEKGTAETVADGESIVAEGLWANAKYLSNTTIGEGKKTVTFTIEADGKILTITLNTDKDKLGEAMYEHDLINDPGFFSILNGIEASWEKDQAYWSFYEGDSLMPYGVNDQNINGGENFRFVYTK